jgi:hypothetical protein
MRSTRWFTHCLAALIGFCTIWAASAAHAELLLIDDFNDGDDIGWTRRDYSDSASGGPGAYAVIDGAYLMNGTSEVPTGQRGGLAATWDASAATLYQNGYLRARVKANSNSLVWLTMRHQGDSPSFYIFGLDPSNISPVFFWNRIDNMIPGPSGGFDIPGEKVEIGKEWMLEAGAVGNKMSLKVWRPGEPEPAQPQWTRIDNRYSSGLLGVGANHWAPQPPAMVSATFDDVMFRPVPEPYGITLAAAAVVGCCCWRSARRPTPALANAARTASLVLLITAVTQPAHAATVFYDDFEDGSLIDENPVSWVVPQWIPNGQYRVENGDLILTASNIPPTQPGYNRARTEMDVLADDVNVGNLSLRTRLRGLSPGTPGNPYYIGVTVRDTLSRDNLIGSFISAYIGSDGQIGVGYVRDTTTTAGGGTAVNHPLVSTGLDFANQDVDLQLDVVNNLAMLTVWDQSQAKPTSPQIEMRLPSYLASQGTIGLWVFPSANEWNKPALFRFVEVVAIPEPSTLGLLGLAAAGGMGRTSRGRRPAVR